MLLFFIPLHVLSQGEMANFQLLLKSLGLDQDSSVPLAVVSDSGRI